MILHAARDLWRARGRDVAAPWVAMMRSLSGQNNKGGSNIAHSSDERWGRRQFQQVGWQDGILSMSKVLCWTSRESRPSNRPIRMDVRDDFWGRAEGSFNKSVDKMSSYQWAKFCVELRERADLQTDLFGWTREKTMIYSPRRVAN